MVDISFKPILSIPQVREIKKGEKHPEKDRQQKKRHNDKHSPPKKGRIDIKA